MHLRQAASRERFMLVFALPVVLAGCARGLPSDMPDESNGARGSGAPEPQLLSVAYTHEPSPAAVAGAVRKVVRRHNYVLEFGDYEAEVDPADGGRIVALRVDGQNALLERSASPEAYGSSFWPSPQSAWRWPPPPEFDKLAWNVEARDGRVLLESLTNEALGLAAKQALHADLGRGALIIEYTLENRGTKAVGVAPWQNTRMPPGGMTFFPSEEGSLPPSTLDLGPAEGVVWMQHDPDNPKEAKAFADGQEGWLAHLGGDLLFVKVFADVPRERQAPEEAEIEIYLPASGRFVEVEQQGSYAELAPGAHSSWTVVWLLRRLPADVPAKPGAELLDYTRKLVMGARQ